MKRSVALNVFASWLAAVALYGCRLPGRPMAGPEIPRPQELMAFEPLYRQNCAGCHGVAGQNGSATNLSNPEYQGWIDDASLRAVIANGEKGSLMPAFAMSKGGTLTDAQVDVLVKGMRQKWSRSDAFNGATPPPYHPSTDGLSSAGQAVYSQACARCHGATVEQPGTAGSILASSFLALMNAQTLRTTIVAGRPDIGQPDWRHDIVGRELTDAEVTNVTSYLLAQTPPGADTARISNGDESARSSHLKLSQLQ